MTIGRSRRDAMRIGAVLVGVAVGGLAAPDLRAAGDPVARADSTPPSKPGGFGAGAGSPISASLFWNPATDPESGIRDYNVYRDGRRVARVTGTTYVDTGLVPSTHYSYEVSAVNGDGIEGPRAGPLPVTTPPDPTPPGQPGGLNATAVDTSTVDLAWSAASDPESGIKEYLVYRDGQSIARVQQRSYRDRGLRPATRYVYEVSAVNGAGMEGQKSAPAPVNTPAPVDVTPPGRPGDLQAETRDTSRINVTWSAASDPESGIKEYVVYRDGSAVARVSGTSFLNRGLVPATAYSYEVSAINGADLEGPRAGPVTASTRSARDGTAPTAPSGLQASAEGPERIRLTWSAAQDPESGVAGYRVYRDGQEVAFVSSTSFVDTGLRADTRYDYRVAAVNGDGAEGPSTATVTARTPPGADTVPPAPPSGLRIVP